MTDTWVQRTADDFAAAIENLMPTGAAWSRDPDGGLMKWCDGVAAIWGDLVEVKNNQLLNVDSDPRYTVEMLPDWERNFGLPDPCVKQPNALTLVERRAALVNKMTTQGGSSRAFFIGVAKALGYNISIREYVPFQFGISSFGGSHGAVYGPECRFYWQIKVGAPRFTRFQFGYSQAGRDNFLHIMRSEDLECVLNRWKPAHTILIFDYVQMSQAFKFFFPY